MPRAYEQSHPWISFSLDLRPAPPELWVLLGEIRSKCEHIRNVPLLPRTRERLHLVYLAKGVRATTAIEGNTLSEAEVLQIVEGRSKLPASRQYLAREVENVLGAINESFKRIASGVTPVLSREVIESLNARILSGLELEPGVVAGQVRRHSVGVARYRGAPAEDCEFLLERLSQWLSSEELILPRELDPEGAASAVLRAVVAHLYLAWIHPFGDGNGRTARLVEFVILAAAGIPTPVPHLLSNHYNQTREEYYRQLDQSSRSGGGVIPFVLYAARGLLDQLRQQLEVMHEQHRRLMWRSYVEERHAGPPSEARLRQVQLAIALGEVHSPSPIGAIRSLTPALAAAYATRTPKTLARDLSALVAREIVESTPEGFRARLEVIQAMLPVIPR